jgi:hypothetical protein
MKENIEHLNSNNEQNNKQNNMVEWRREKVQLLVSQGYTQREIADKIKVSLGTINNDLSYLRKKARENIKKYVDEKIPEEYEKCLIGLNSILRESWTMSDTAIDKREKIEALKLARDCYSMRLDLLTNSNVINDSMRFIEKSKEKQNLSSKKENIDSDSNSDVQRSTEINNNTEESQYNQVF